ncbi:MAG TPA: right-handed parallel beta-helix repeat-containing protein [Solirubrobacteraceae bacterium]|jgi:hypothetical protein
MSQPPGRRARRLVALSAFLLLMLPAAASAQATRTYVSGVGDDVNPCSRTAPCKTWAGAISKTAAGGEMNAIDSGGFGAVTVTKSITIDGNGHHSSILACGTNGVVVNSATAKVTVRDVAINGCRNAGSPGFNGIRAIAAKSLRVEDVRIMGFSIAGIALEPSNANARVRVHRTRVHDNGEYGILAKPATGGSLRTTLSRVRLDDNGNGVHANSANGASKVRIFDSTVTDSGTDGSTGYGLWSDGQTASIRAGDNRITGNVQGLFQANFGTLVSYGGNIVDDNDTDGIFTSSVARK